MRRPTALLSVAALLLSAAARMHAQAQPPFKSGVTLVTIDVTVLDRDGRPVPNLAAADFEVKLNGKVQPIRGVTFLQASAPNAMAGAVGPTFDAVTPATAPAAAPAVPSPVTPRAFVILVDDLSFAPTRGRGLFAAAQRFLASLPATDRVGLATTTGTKVVNPTTDRAALRETLATVVGAYIDPKSNTAHGPSRNPSAPDQPDQAVGINQALAIERGDAGALEDAVILECFNGDRRALLGKSMAQVIAETNCASTVQMEARRTASAIKQTVERQLQAYQSVIRAMQPAGGIRHLVLLTDGIGLAQDVTALAPVARAASEAGVQVSVIMESADASMTDEGRRDPGLGNPQQTDVGASQRRREDDALFLNGAKTVADNIGATFHHVVGSPDPFFQRVTLAASAVYRLAVEPPSGTAAGRDFALSARVKRPGVTILASRRAVASTPGATTTAALPIRPAETSRAPMTVDEQLRSAIATGRAARGLDITLTQSVRRAADPSQVSIEVTVDVAATAVGPLDTLLGVVDDRGAIRTARKQVDAESPTEASRHLEFSIPLAPGVYKIRFAAADAAGKVGAVESVVDAKLLQMGTLPASALRRIAIDAGGARRPIAGDTIPAGTQTLAVALDLYPAANTPTADLLVKIALAATGGGAPVERIISPESRDDALVAEAEFPLERLPPGSYMLTATVLSGTTVLGTTSAVIKR